MFKILFSLSSWGNLSQKPNSKKFFDFMTKPLGNIQYKDMTSSAQ